MNSEELEQSLRSEFENHLKNLRAQMKQEAAEFQDRINSETEKHRSSLDDAFRAYTDRFDPEQQLDVAFASSVGEHLRLARDEGARIAADAMAEAEKLAPPPPAPIVAEPVEVKYDKIRDAVADISSKDSQSAILKSLVQHAGEFAPRGAFFIIKSDHLVGWKTFGSNDDSGTAIREVHFPVSSGTTLGEAVSSQRTVGGTGAGNSADGVFLDPIGFSAPETMYAIPLVARGRAVAVLYVDADNADDINLDALETLTNVSGLTVELHAAQSAATGAPMVSGDLDHEQPEHEAAPVEAAASYQTPEVEQPPVQQYTPEPEVQTGNFSFTETPVEEVVAEETASVDEYQPAQEFTFEPSAGTPSYETETFETIEPIQQSQETSSFETSPFETTVQEEETVENFATPTFDPAPVAFDSGGSIESASFERSPFDVPAEEYQSEVALSGTSSTHVVEPIIEAPVVAPPPQQTRLSDRHVDLPIEVPEDERRIHNDARRFARLLVSEIKLYNEKKVVEGRESNDLYDRLKEAIDRSREMYDKRVQPPVAAKFDYFHYELVNSLADGDSSRLGAGYSGATV